MRENSTEPTRQEINEAIAKAFANALIRKQEMWMPGYAPNYFADPKACEDAIKALPIRRVAPIYDTRAEHLWRVALKTEKEVLGTGKGKTLAEAMARAIYEAIK